jgi:hypothetical protein
MYVAQTYEPDGELEAAQHKFVKNGIQASLE